MFFCGGIINGFNPLEFIGISADELRCLTDEEIKKLILKKSKEKVSLYKNGDKEREKIIKIYKVLISDKNFRDKCVSEIFSDILEISKDNLKNGFPLRSMTLCVIDIFKKRTLFSVDERGDSIKYDFCFDENGNLSIINGRNIEKVVDRKIVGCVRYGTRPYSVLESMIKNRAVSYEEELYFSHGRIRRDVKMIWNSFKAKNIPLECFPFGIEQYIYPGIEEHSILLSLKEGGMIVPEGKIEGIYLR